jgi:hypothetical protein
LDVKFAGKVLKPKRIFNDINFCSRLHFEFKPKPEKGGRATLVRTTFSRVPSDLDELFRFLPEITKSEFEKHALDKN